jgi:hypothetical protein
MGTSAFADALNEASRDAAFWKECAKKAQAELLAAGKQNEKLQEDLAAMQKERDEHKQMRDANGVTLAAAIMAVGRVTDERDAALAEVSRVRAECEEWKRTTIADEVKALCSENAKLEAARLSAYVLHPDTPGDENVKRIAATVRDEIYAVDARRAGGEDGAK